MAKGRGRLDRKARFVSFPSVSGEKELGKGRGVNNRRVTSGGHHPSLNRMTNVTCTVRFSCKISKSANSIFFGGEGRDFLIMNGLKN